MSGLADSNDILDQLFVDREELDKALLLEIVAPFVKLQRDTTEILPTERWKELNLQQKILVYLLSRKVMASKQLISEEEEKATPVQIERDTGIKGNSIRPTLSRLLTDRLVKFDKSAKAYWVPNYALSDTRELFKEKR